MPILIFSLFLLPSFLLFTEESYHRIKLGKGGAGIISLSLLGVFQSEALLSAADPLYAPDFRDYSDPLNPFLNLYWDIQFKTEKSVIFAVQFPYMLFLSNRFLKNPRLFLSPAVPVLTLGRELILGSGKLLLQGEYSFPEDLLKSLRLEIPGYFEYSPDHSLSLGVAYSRIRDPAVTTISAGAVQLFSPKTGRRFPPGDSRFLASATVTEALNSRLAYTINLGWSIILAYPKLEQPELHLTALSLLSLSLHWNYKNRMLSLGSDFFLSGRGTSFQTRFGCTFEKPLDGNER